MTLIISQHVFVRLENGLVMSGQVKAISVDFVHVDIQSKIDPSINSIHLVLHRHVWPDWSLQPQQKPSCRNCMNQKMNIKYSKNSLIQCSNCFCHYHLECHVPPLNNLSTLSNTNWLCRDCITQAICREGGAVCEGELAQRYNLWKRIRPYNNLALTWDSERRRNRQQVYCYCGGPGHSIIGPRMLQCCVCRQWYHEACLQTIRRPLVSWDSYWALVCACCAPEGCDEFVQRLPLRWVDLAHIGILNLLSSPDQFHIESIHLTKQLLPWLRSQWTKLCLSEVISSQQLRFVEMMVGLERALNAHPKRFDVTEPCFYRLRAGLPLAVVTPPAFMSPGMDLSKVLWHTRIVYSNLPSLPLLLLPLPPSHEPFPTSASRQNLSLLTEAGGVGRKKCHNSDTFRRLKARFSSTGCAEKTLKRALQKSTVTKVAAVSAAFRTSNQRNCAASRGRKRKRRSVDERMVFIEEDEEEEEEEDVDYYHEDEWEFLEEDSAQDDAVNEEDDDYRPSDEDSKRKEKSKIAAVEELTTKLSSSDSVLLAENETACKKSAAPYHHMRKGRKSRLLVMDDGDDALVSAKEDITATDTTTTTDVNKDGIKSTPIAEEINVAAVHGDSNTEKLNKTRALPCVVASRIAEENGHCDGPIALCHRVPSGRQILDWLDNVCDVVPTKIMDSSFSRHPFLFPWESPEERSLKIRRENWLEQVACQRISGSSGVKNACSSITRVSSRAAAVASCRASFMLSGGRIRHKSSPNSRPLVTACAMRRTNGVECLMRWF